MASRTPSSSSPLAAPSATRRPRDRRGRPRRRRARSTCSTRPARSTSRPTRAGSTSASSPAPSSPARRSIRSSDLRPGSPPRSCPLGALVGFVFSRTVGLPGGADDIGNWTEPLGLASLFVEGSLVALGAARARPDRGIAGAAAGDVMKRALAAAVAVLALGAGTTGKAATAVSSNWAGYAVCGTTYSSRQRHLDAAGRELRASTPPRPRRPSGSGSAATPRPRTRSSRPAPRPTARATAPPRYSAWYELVPAGSVKVALKVSAGDRISASVKVNGTKVTVQLQNLTTGKTSFTEDAHDGRAGRVARPSGSPRRPRLCTPGGAARSAADRLRDRQLHERDRDRDERPHRHDLRLRLDGDPIEPRLRRSAAPGHGFGPSPPRRRRGRHRRALPRRQRLLDHLEPDRRCTAPHSPSRRLSGNPQQSLRRFEP